MKKLLYVGHPYHLKSHSDDFMRNELAKSYEIDYLSVADNCVLPEEFLRPFEGREYDVCLCWQVMPSVKLLRRHLSFRHGVLFPMADYYYGMLPVDTPIWEEYREFRIFSFSRKVHDELSANGFDSTYLQYFPKPRKVKNWGDSRSVFFWQRITHLNVYTVLEALKGFPMKHLRLHMAIDPREQTVLLPTVYQRDFGVSYSSWYDSREEMLRDIEKFAVYFAPRRIEGIGLAYLEAMAMGRCVIANRDTTHDEYITHGENGYLYDLFSEDKCVNLTVADVSRVQRNAHEFIKRGYAQWVKRLSGLADEFEVDARPDMTLAKPPRKVDMGDPAACILSPTEFAASAANGGGHDPEVGEPAGDYVCKATHSFLGIPLVRKFVRRDGGEMKASVLGVTVFSAEISKP